MVAAVKYKRTDETRRNISRAMINKPFNEEHKRNISRNHKGTLGMTFCKETRRKISLAKTGHSVSEETKKKISLANMDHSVSEATRKKISETLIGRTVSEGTKKRISKTTLGRIIGPASREAREKNSRGHMGHKVSLETRERISKANTGRIPSEEHKRNMSKSLKSFFANASPERLRDWGTSHHLKPNTPEILLDCYLKKRYPKRWLYNGDGSQGITIGRKIPDFVRRDEVKEVIEVFGTYWHGEDEVEPLILHYEKLGFKCVVIWEYDCYLDKELDKIFSNGGK